MLRPETPGPAPANVPPGPEPAPPRAGAGPARGWAQWRRPVLVAVGATLALRVVTEFIALVSQYGVAFPHVVAHSPQTLVDVWAHWDTGYYLTIAQHGYMAATSAGHPVAVQRIAAFGPLYPALIRVVHALTRAGWTTSGQLVSAGACVVALAGLFRLSDEEGDRSYAGLSVTVLVAFPTAFFLLADYPESLGLALVVWGFIAARRGRWLAAGLAAGAATATKFYLAIVVVALLVEVWQGRTPLDWRRTGPGPHPAPHPGTDTGTAPGTGTGTRSGWPLAAAEVTAPTVLFLVAWVLVSRAIFSDGLAFLHAQAAWNRHFAGPWTLVANTAGDLVHWRFLDTSTASVMELFDTLTVVLLLVTAFAAFRWIRRSYGVLLGLALCAFTFQNILYSETREVLVLFPFFGGIALWAQGHPWRERLLLAFFLPSAFFLVQRFVTNKFAG